MYSASKCVLEVFKLNLKSKVKKLFIKKKKEDDPA